MKILKLSMLTALAIILTSASFIKADEKSPSIDKGIKDIIIIDSSFASASLIPKVY